MSARVHRAIGLMSGTSIDGIDVAMIETDGENHVATGPALTLPYDETLRAGIRGVLGGKGDVAAADWSLTMALGAAVARLRQDHHVDGIDVIGCHGHTILHRPQAGYTWQIGNGKLLAELTHTDVVCDFRSADVAAGGEGAPLAPLYHAALAADLPKPLAVLNIGGVANVTWIGNGPDDLLAFDTGPGNALIDDWVLRHTGKPLDADGALARVGKVDDAAVAKLLAHPYFFRTPPKSLDRNEFAALVPNHLSPADGAATLTAMTVAAVRHATEHFPTPATHWLVTGGGRHNRTLMVGLKRALGVDVEPVESAGWDGDALEAQAFAYLAVRSLAGLPLSLPATTGVAHPMTGGRLFRAG
jgi:anhydro-N-acetylmuramic acid kinase